jgi:hypothetical protein
MFIIKGLLFGHYYDCLKNKKSHPFWIALICKELLLDVQ